MGRKLRIQYPGAIHHVMIRGDASNCSAIAESPFRKWRQAVSTEVATRCCKSDEAADVLQPKADKVRSSLWPNCAETDPFHASVRLEDRLQKMEIKLSGLFHRPDFTGGNRSFNPSLFQR